MPARLQRLACGRHRRCGGGGQVGRVEGRDRRTADTQLVAVTGDAQATADDGVGWVGALVRDLAIPGLSNYGLGANDVEELVEKAGQASSMKSNPIALTTPELATTLQAAL